MVHRIKVYVDGGCRRNGSSDAIGAAAAVIMTRSGKGHYTRTQQLGRKLHEPTPTNQRAELTAIILGLRRALERYERLQTYPRLEVTICSDSRYAVQCMNTWISGWQRNDWTNSRGTEVANQDLMRELIVAENEIRKHGKAWFYWNPREQNYLADKYCNEELNSITVGSTINHVMVIDSSSSRSTYYYSD